VSVIQGGKGEKKEWVFYQSVRTPVFIRNY